MKSTKIYTPRNLIRVRHIIIMVNSIIQITQPYHFNHRTKLIEIPTTAMSCRMFQKPFCHLCEKTLYFHHT